MWLLDHIKTEWATVVKAPLLLLAVLALGAFLGWTVASTFYEQDLQTLRDQLAPYLLQQNAPLVKAVASPVSSTSPTPSDSSVLLSENAKLRAENTRLKRIKVPHAVAGSPLACPSTVSSVATSRVSADDCDDLTKAQQLWDSAEQDRMRAAPGEFGSIADGQKYAAAVRTEDDAAQSLQRIEARLCTERKVR